MRGVGGEVEVAAIKVGRATSRKIPLRRISWPICGRVRLLWRCRRTHKTQAKPGKNGKIDKSVLAISEPKSIRSKEHLRYVASQPCVICGRTPPHAHHLRHAQPRGLALKVRDEFTVPLCAIHHDEIHRTTKERAWWQDRHVDPLPVAATLWRESGGARSHSNGNVPTSDGATEADGAAEQQP